MHMRKEEFESFQKNWDAQEKVKQEKIMNEKQLIKSMIKNINKP